jgi:hypothetical protein
MDMNSRLLKAGIGRRAGAAFCAGAIALLTLAAAATDAAPVS